LDLREVTTITQDSDRVQGDAGFTITIVSEEVVVEGRPVKRYQLMVETAEDTLTLTEIADAKILSQRTLGNAVDLQLAFFGAEGYLVTGTGFGGRFRVVEAERSALTADVTVRVRGDTIFSDDGRGPFRSWESRTMLVGEEEALSDLIRKAADGNAYFEAAIQDTSPVLKFLRVRGAFQRGEIPELSADNILVRGPGGFVRFLANFFSQPEANIVDALTSVSENLANLSSTLAETANADLQSIYNEIVAAKVFGLIRCIDAGGFTGSINGPAFDECVDELDDLGEAVGEIPDCDAVNADRTFAAARCNTGAPNTFNRIDVIDELCDVNRAFGPEVFAQDQRATAKGFVAEIEKNLNKLKAKIWDKILRFCPAQ
jgi:hypothetical protein